MDRAVDNSFCAHRMQQEGGEGHTTVAATTASGTDGNFGGCA
jgi:hypothetical protein